ncbi:flagellar protein FlaG [Azoarcus sp. DN11]|uniref:flagellar protein FlaG n=1 Tax=Azoarcus sp. DN11 TaxID=356837 RepID=UPI000EB041F2|nr:flagellar protein FlaG [Azoarcus sp. DN11]AYH43111.1 hypothetical protein CDA09_06885 [Azoarcus sp. DN11]
MSIQPIPPAAANLAQQLAGPEASNPAVRQAAGVSAETPVPGTAGSADATRIGHALDEVRKALAPVAQNLLFSIDDNTGRTVIKIIDSSTDEVIKQIPSEEILAIAKALDKLQGLLVRQHA